MGIYNIAASKTEGIGVARYAENGVTGNLPVAYVIEKGVTVKLFSASSEEKLYTPTGDVAYLYNRGEMSDVLGGFTDTYEFASGGSTIVLDEEDGYLSLTFPKGAATLGIFKSNHAMDLSAYSKIYVEFEYVNASTGESVDSLGTLFMWKLVNDAGEGFVNYLTLNNSPTSLSVGDYDGGFHVILSHASASGVMSSTDDVVLKIYSIYVTKE